MKSLLWHHPKTSKGSAQIRVGGVLALSLLCNWVSVETAWARSFPTTSGVVSFSAQMYDEGQQKWQPQTGTGTLIAPVDSTPGVVADEVFLVTSAHLTQGQNWSVGSAEGKGSYPLDESAIQGSVTDPLCDLTAISIRLDRLPGGSQNYRAFAQAERDSKGRMRFFAFPERLQEWLGRDPRFVRDEKGRGYLNVEPNTAGGAFVLVPSWSNGGTAEASTLRSSTGFGFDRSIYEPDIGVIALGKRYSAAVLNRGLHNSILYQAFGDRITAPARLAPGMSGSPLLKLVTNAMEFSGHRWEVRGFGTEYIEDMTGSNFCSDRALQKMLEAYVPGRQTKLSQGEWRFRYGRAYLKYSERSSEIVATQQKAGRGGAVSPGVTLEADAAASNGDYWERLGSLPAIEWEGHKAIGFKVYLKSGKQTIFIYPNQAAVALLQSYGVMKEVAAKTGARNKPAAPKRKYGLEYEPVLLGSSIYEQLASRFKANINSFNPRQASSVNLNLCLLPVLGVDDEGVSHLVLTSPDSRDEVVNLRLDRWGRVMLENGAPARDHFAPLVIEKSTRAREFIVDLREFFFMDVSVLNFSADDRSDIDSFESILKFSDPKSAVNLLERVLENESRKGAFISYRHKSANYSIRTRFQINDPGEANMPFVPMSFCRQ